MATLDDLNIVKVSGEQRFDYLNGQLTVSTKGFDGASARLSAHCDFKGKMFAAIIISQCNDAFLLSMHKDSAIISQEQLKKYGVFSKVDIQISEELHCIGIAGDENIKQLRQLFPALNSTHMSTTNNAFGQAICFNDASLRYLCYLSDKGKQKLLDIRENDVFAPCDSWNILEIEAGIANIQTATMSQFVPQMLNFQSIHAIDFDKGCYMGQEVVARTKFLGKNKRATFLLSGTLESELNINAGDNIELQIGDSWRRGGVIVRAVSSPNAMDESGNSKTVKLLAVMPKDTDPNAAVRLKDSDVRLSVTPLPYTLTS
jgi:hypothetical protein